MWILKWNVAEATMSLPKKNDDVEKLLKQVISRCNKKNYITIIKMMKQGERSTWSQIMPCLNGKQSIIFL